MRITILKFVVLIVLFNMVVSCKEEKSKEIESSDYEPDKSFLIPVQIGEKWGIIYPNGEYMYNPVLESWPMFPKDTTKLILISEGDYPSNEFYFINYDGEKIIDVQQVLFDYFKKNDPKKLERPDYLVKAYGMSTIIDRPKPHSVSSFSSGVAKIEYNLRGVCYFLDSKGKIVLSLNENGNRDKLLISDFKGDIANMTEGLSFEYQYINKKGEIINTTPSSPRWFEADATIKGLIGFEKNGKVGFMDKRGKIVITPQFEKINQSLNGLAGAKINGKWGFVDSTGRFVISPQFENVDFFYDPDIAGVQIGEKWGFVNRKGKIIIPPLFDKIGYFRNELANVSIDGKWGYINKNGDFVIEPKYHYANPCHSKKLLLVANSNNIIYIDITGQIIIDKPFEDAFDFYHSLAAVKLDGKWGIIDDGGKFVLLPQFDGIDWPYDKTVFGNCGF